MRISDWSSDVCSSDLADRAHDGKVGVETASKQRLDLLGRAGREHRPEPRVAAGAQPLARWQEDERDERHLVRDAALDWQSVGLGQGVSVRVDLGGRRIRKTKNNRVQTQQTKKY